MRSPLRQDDLTASFSIFDGGKRFADKARLDIKGDVYTFASLAFNIPIGEAMRRVFCMAGDTEPFVMPVHRLHEAIRRLRPVRLLREAQRDRPRTAFSAPLSERSTSVVKPFPVLQSPLMATHDEIRAITASRGLREEAGKALAEHGHLIVVHEHGQLGGWALCDAPGWLPPTSGDISGHRAPSFPPAAAIIERRRLDRQPFAHGAKAHTVRGSVKSWPVGISVLGWPGREKSMVLVVEGGPDLLAAHDFLEGCGIAHEAVPIALLSREISRLHPEAARLLQGRHVHIIPHNDPDREGQSFRMGASTAQKWADSLFWPAGAQRVTFATLRGLTRPDGQPAKDLCEAMEANGHWRHHDARRSPLWDLLPHHAREFRSS